MGWVLLITVGDLWSRVADQWVASLTMLFGSFLSGSSPMGGSAAAFPVFTKGLQVPVAVARTFGLLIQTVGMGVATVSILLNRRPIHVRGTLVASGAAIGGFLIALYGLGDRSAAFWPSAVPSPWVKATFSIVLATTSLMMVRRLRIEEAASLPLEWGRRLDVGLVVVAAFGGALASMTGTGANILVFLFLVLLCDVSPSVALPSAVIVMAAVSVVGFVVLGLGDGQLFVGVVGERVVEVGGVATDLAADRNDLPALWLAAVPVAVWLAPLGSWVASKVREAQLVSFVAVLAAVEVVTTCLLVRELRSEPELLVYLIVGLVLMPVALIRLRRHRHDMFGRPPAR